MVMLSDLNEIDICPEVSKIIHNLCHLEIVRGVGSGRGAGFTQDLCLSKYFLYMLEL